MPQQPKQRRAPVVVDPAHVQSTGGPAGSTSLCTACHRVKTDQERVARQLGLPAYAVPVGPPSDQAARS